MRRERDVARQRPQDLERPPEFVRDLRRVLVVHEHEPGIDAGAADDDDVQRPPAVLYLHRPRRAAARVARRQVRVEYRPAECHLVAVVPGSSDYFLGGIVAYAYEAKVALLNVSWDTLKIHGAVSRETVLEMARGARKALGADLAISASGIAGPGGGLPGKPVGTTWFGLSAINGEWAYLHQFKGDRMQNKSIAADTALSILVDYLRGGAK